KNTSTIYEIAAHKDYQHLGIGRNLLWSVPTPVRLKVTQDNKHANTFYQSLNMRLTGTEQGRKRPLNVYELKSLFIYCQGNNKKFPLIAQHCGVGYGTRSDEKAQSYPFMLDINWEEYDWKCHLKAIMDYRPVMVCAPDYTDKSQYDDLMGKIAELRALGVIRIVVVPKFKSAVKDIPEDCVIGISIPSSYAGYVPDDEDTALIRGRYVHLLGGSPKAQREFYRDYTAHGIHVISADGNGFQRNCSFGMYFEDGKWKRPTYGKFAFGDMYGGMKHSLKNIVSYLHGDDYQIKLIERES
ncbi:MAG TPA: hypothetical protein PLZ51_09685, partial [Aggregatilineales bacterium]|nr:hypothetical protein [Aggregatilineales bacterium]